MNIGKETFMFKLKENILLPNLSDCLKELITVAQVNVGF